MKLIGSGSTYDRSRILDAAARARARRRWTHAIELYRRVLAMEPQNLELHIKLAPLLAQTGQHFDAWCSFRTVARQHLRAGHDDKALAVYRDAALYLPREAEAWEAVARLLHRGGQSRDALETLLEGSRHFHTRWLRPQAIYLLRRARELDAWNFEVVLEMALLLRGNEQTHEARLLLEGLAERSGGERLLHVRAAQLRVSPGPKTLWLWLRERAGLLGGAPQSAGGNEPSHRAVVPLRAARRA